MKHNYIFVKKMHGKSIVSSTINMMNYKIFPPFRSEFTRGVLCCPRYDIVVMLLPLCLQDKMWIPFMRISKYRRFFLEFITTLNRKHITNDYK